MLRLFPAAAIILAFSCSGGGGTTSLIDMTEPDAATDDRGESDLPDGFLPGDVDWEQQPDDLPGPEGIEPVDIIPADGLDLAEGVDIPLDWPGDPAPDMGPEWCAEEGGFGCSCESNADCLSNWCVETPQGYLCTQTCVEECPAEGWTCTQIQEPPDVVYACMPVHSKLCRPCYKTQECQGIVIGSKSLCVDMGPKGNFCGGDCSEDGFPCPDGYKCKNATSIEGEEGDQCIPAAGECTCSPIAIEMELATSCYYENEYGLCEGERSCGEEGLSECSANEPGPEICNGEDDDCNGVADDDLIQEECLVENEWGGCPGTVLCVGGEPLCQGKEPAAETCDGLDNDCDDETDENFSDCDSDGIADCIETDDDADGWPDTLDNCPCMQNPNQLDTDQDQIGNACDTDDDNDGVADNQDCEPLNPAVYPGVLEDCNGLDDDCDDLVDEGFLDSDQDGVADCVDLDDDGDGVPDTLDNCPAMPNQEQLDSDFDKQGDVCDPDDDGDGYPDDNDCGPLDKMIFPGAAELCDCKDNNCDGNADEGFTDTDGDGVADCCEDDTDGDGVPNGIDNCPYVDNPDQVNTDGDLTGEACDPDDDNDGVVDALDCNPTEVKAYPNAPEICDGIDNDCDGTVDNNFPDLDGDGEANCIDPDDDGDSIPDLMDKCPFLPDPLQTDTDGDGLGDVCDGDDDGDGDFDLTDCEPLNPGVHHGATEFCNGKDDDCDKKVDEAGSVGCVPLFPDSDGDGFGADGGEACMCNMEPPFTAFQGGDCDDDDAAINPLVMEICDGQDNDCDGLEDPEDAQGCEDYFLDEDDDGYGVDKEHKCLCTPEPPYSATEVGDCAPNEPEAYPGNLEVCDGIDNDCDGLPDNVAEEDCIDFYKDEDEDGFGVDDDFICQCEPEPEDAYTATEGGDCDDENPDSYPGAEEVCGDVEDNNCDGQTDENCFPSQVMAGFVSMGISTTSGSYKVDCGIGMEPAASKMTNGQTYSAEIGLFPTSMLGQ